MNWRLRRQENSQGEWSVLDPVLGYRICRYNHLHHAGAHVHAPDGKVVGSIDVDSGEEADAVMRRYQSAHGGFDLQKLNGEVKAWRSESKKS